MEITGKETINIYCLIDPSNDAPFYVGATKYEINKRLKEHLRETLYKVHCFSPKELKIREILGYGAKPLIKLLYVCSLYDVNFYEPFFYNMLINQNFTLLQHVNSFGYHHKKKENKKQNVNYQLIMNSKPSKSKLIAGNESFYDEDNELWYCYVGANNEEKTLLLSVWGKSPKECQSLAHAFVEFEGYNFVLPENKSE